MYARFFDNFKDRTLEDLKEMDKKRTWDVDLRNIKFFNNFEEKIPSYVSTLAGTLNCARLRKRSEEER